MAKISGWVYLIVGILVVIISFFVEGIWFFKYVGMLFLIIGIAKLLIKYMNERADKPKTSRPTKKQGSFCSKCGAEIRGFFNYCYNCGNKLK